MPSPQSKYRKAHVKRIYWDLLDTTDKDIIKVLFDKELTPNRSAYLKSLVREDIKKRGLD